jgi:hypothetical protein
MPTPSCALCEIPFTPENDSREHVITNAIGGRKKIKGFICVACNNGKGAVWDAELARQLNPICLQLGITREHGDVPAQAFKTMGGDRYVREPDGKLRLAIPKLEKTQDGNGEQMKITAQNVSEVRRVINGLKRKHPHLDVDAIMARASQQSRYLKDLLNIELHFGGEVSGRSIVKSALAMAFAAGIPPTICEIACDYLRNPAANARWDYFYATDLISNRPPGTPVHCVAIQGRNGKLVGYVEFFGFRRMWVPLSDNYSGTPIQASYAIDPVSGKELNLDVATLPLQVSEMPVSEMQPLVIAALNKVWGPSVKAANDKEFDQVLRSAWERACEQMNLKADDPITTEQRKRFSVLLVKEMMPFIEHQLHNPFRNWNPSGAPKLV